MPVSKLDNPAMKLAIEDIVYISEEAGSWVFANSSVNFNINLLWIQGTIKSISDDFNEVLLQENRKSIVVKNCKSIPGGNNWMKIGQYIMVFGEIQDLEGMTMTVKAIKISDLSDNPLYKEMWPYDVKEAKLIYADLAK